MNSPSRLLRACAALVLCATAVATAHAQSYPDRPIRFVIPYPPGGVVDPFARSLAERLSDRLGKQVVAENRPGASLIIGTEAVAKAPADGYTMLLASASSLSINAGAFKKLPYDPVKDFAPVSLGYFAPLFLVAGPHLGVNSVQELIAKAKANPGKISYATLGHGSSLHLAAKLFESLAGIELLHVPYKGNPSAMADLLTGRVDISFGGGAFLPQVEAGTMKLLAITSPNRIDSLPKVPTMAESGVAGYDIVIWFGVVVPAGTPKPTVDRLAKEVAEIVKEPAFRQRFASSGIQLVSNSPEEFSGLIRRDTVKWTKLLRDAGVQPE